MKRGLLTFMLLLCVSAPRADTVAIDIQGIGGELQANVRAYLGVVRYAEVDLSELNIRRLHARAEEEIRAALRPFGYYTPSIESTLSQEGDRWNASYTIAPGEAVIISEVDLEVGGEGRDDQAFRNILAAPGIAVGDPLSHARYEQLKQRLRQTAADRGYRQARLSRRVLEVRPTQLEASIRLQLETGPRYRISRISIQQEVLKPELAERYVKIRPGDFFDAGKLLDLQYALTDSEYFSLVEVGVQEDTTPTSGESPSVAITVRTAPRKRHRYTFGVGYGTDTRQRVSAGWQNRRINRRGHRLSIDTRLSPVKSTLEAVYTVPLRDPTRERIALTIAVDEQELGATDSRKIETSIVHTGQLGEWQRQLYVRLARERTRLPDETNVSTLLVPGTTYTRVRTNSAVYPTRGSRISADLHGAHSVLGSDADFLRLRIDTRLVRPIGARNRLLMRAVLGTSLVAEFSELPASERFFAGGDQSVRGFAYNSLGPMDADGNVLGGEHLLAGGVEYEQRLQGKWALAVFVDAGNAIDDFGESLEYSLGFGVRYQTVVGMVRGDFARPLSRDGAGFRFHLSIGPEL